MDEFECRYFWQPPVKLCTCDIQVVFDTIKTYGMLLGCTCGAKDKN